MRICKFLVVVLVPFLLSHCDSDSDAAPESGAIGKQNQTTPWNGDEVAGKIVNCMVGDYSTEDKLDDVAGWGNNEVPVTIKVRSNNAMGKLLIAAKEKSGERAFCSEFSGLTGSSVASLVADGGLLITGFDKSLGEAAHSGAIGDAKAFNYESIDFGNVGEVCGKKASGVLEFEISTVQKGVRVPLLGVKTEGEDTSSLSSFELVKSGSGTGTYESLLADCAKSAAAATAAKGADSK